jgi:hypothetical protein
MTTQKAKDDKSHGGGNQQGGNHQRGASQKDSRDKATGKKEVSHDQSKKQS